MSDLENMTDAERNSAILQRLMNHPEVGREAKRLWKKIEPAARFPDLELEDQVAKSTKELQEKVDKMEQDQLEGRVRANRDSNHAKVKAAGFEVE